MLQPKRTKFRKYQKGRIGGSKKDTLHFGEYGLQVLESTRLKASTLESIRRVITRKLKRQGQVWIRVFPDIPVTQKPAEVRMGKGKGAPGFWIARVKKGQMLVEMSGVARDTAFQAALLAHHKLPFSTKFVEKEGKNAL